ncbi:MAG: hypothetical protein R2788_12150 [Saprospiraceae bacterium]
MSLNLPNRLPIFLGADTCRPRLPPPLIRRIKKLQVFGIQADELWSFVQKEGQQTLDMGRDMTLSTVCGGLSYRWQGHKGGQEVLGQNPASPARL